MAYCDPMETPYIYDFFGALWCLSVALQDRVVVARPRAPVHLNMYCMFVAESGITRKSTAVKVASNVVKQFIRDTRYSPLLVEATTSRARLEYDLSIQAVDYACSHAVVCVSELVRFLGKGSAPGLVGVLTDLYDCPRTQHASGTVARGSIVLRDVYINFLSASTPVWLFKSVSAEAVEGGFTSRCYFIAEEKRKRDVAWPDDSDGALDYGALSRILQSIAARGTEYSRVALTAGALDAFTRWYRTRTTARDPYMASFESREDAHVLRIAALLSINDETWHIENRHILAGIRIVNDVKYRGAMLFGGVQRISPALAAIDRLRGRLVEAGIHGLTQSRCLQTVQPNLQARDLQTLFAIMHELELVQRFEVAQVARGRPKIIWRATESLKKPGVIEELYRRMEPT